MKITEAKIPEGLRFIYLKCDECETCWSPCGKSAFVCSNCGSRCVQKIEYGDYKKAA